MKNLVTAVTVALLLFGSQIEAKGIIYINQLQENTEKLKKDLDAMLAETAALSGEKLTKEFSNMSTMAYGLNTKWSALGMGLFNLMFTDQPTVDSQIQALGAIIDILTFSIKRASTSSREIISDKEITPFTKAQPYLEAINKQIATRPVVYAKKTADEVKAELPKFNVAGQMAIVTKEIVLPITGFNVTDPDKKKTLIALVKTLDKIFDRAKMWILL